MDDEGNDFRLVAAAKSGWKLLHEKTGLPWWSTLVVGAVVIRAATFPLCLYGQYHADKLSSLAPELERIRAYVSRSPGTTIQKIRTFRRLRQELLKRSNSSSFKVIPYGKIVHIPLFITAAASARRLMFQRYPGFESEGISWFKDLTAPDPWYILPILNSAILIANTENSLKTVERSSFNSSKGSLGVLAKSLQDPHVVDWVKTILQGMTILVFPLISHLPSGVVFFWTVNSLLNSLQQTLLIGKGRRFVGLRGRSFSAFSYSEIYYGILERAIQEFLSNERRCKRLTLPLSAEIRKDETTGRDYIAIVMESPDEKDSSSKT
ncbi:hypothetical protein GpartN1_g3610.t1 [Galdieria partita]|uniref:Membrane insertase YidC/Oxa/ALB C-terminal domain-containing protein n=1 Tax=Galdieria partita TaxID=83374 RepID=A0A9C7PWL4_9RHOD|nr:hypothetical protein GpartN1_g3610.t1 [Galdieria partita]